jgi:ribosomal protein S18 acetylase RimI-like enzyme
MDKRLIDEQGFRLFLKKAGKKPHVIDGLLGQVLAFHDYLSNAGFSDLDAAGEQQLCDYVDSLDPGSVNKRIRGLALYYRFRRNEALARLASEMRAERIARTRSSFKLGQFRGVDPEHIARLDALEIVTVEDILSAGDTPEKRQQLAEKSGAPLPAILKLVKLADLSRLGAIKAVRARLYYDAGLDTPEKFTHWQTDDLRRYLVEWVARTGFEGIAPLPKELQNAIEAARTQPERVVYAKEDFTPESTRTLMQPPLIFRRAEADQLDEFLSLMQAETASYLDLQNILEAMQITWDEFAELFKQRGEVWVIIQKDRQVGFYWVELRDEIAHLHALILHGEFHGQGIGRACLQHLEEQFRGRARTIELGVHTSAQAAHALYEKSGFVTVRELPELGFVVLQKALE